ncbi:MAG: hypothetical protein O3C43_22035 [Verrucomicrobia bacterium]|nr:hypothetical protein [Verrucomicrobiota bacterium]MDA1069175.1 hypothetical protein [Verrucomicrobiota bacterium]
MAYTPSKDYKRREREQKKRDKKIERDAAKAAKLEEEERLKVARQIASKHKAKDH